MGDVMHDGKFSALLPSGKQWKGWSLQTKIGFIGSFASILGFVLAVGRCSVESAPSKEVEPQIAPFWLHEDDQYCFSVTK